MYKLQSLVIVQDFKVIQSRDARTLELLKYPLLKKKQLPFYVKEKTKVKHS